ncbi:MAG: hypothetical protein GY793_03935 [Proteobacteria bacterium]|nr:hypothetical protein [Pseudomonadota bacterium]
MSSTKTIVLENSEEQDQSSAVTDCDIPDFPEVITYRLDNSALEAGRSPISFRKLNSTIDPKNMSYKEYVNYLCFQYDFEFSKGWDGIERRPHVANWSEDLSHNIQTKEEALAFIDMAKNSKAPDGIEKREQARRKKQKDYRKAKPERRSYYQRKIDKKNEIKHSVQYIITIVICFIIYVILWRIAK